MLAGGPQPGFQPEGRRPGQVVGRFVQRSRRSARQERARARLSLTRQPPENSATGLRKSRIGKTQAVQHFRRPGAGGITADLAVAGVEAPMATPSPRVSASAISASTRRNSASPSRTNSIAGSAEPAFPGDAGDLPGAGQFRRSPARRAIPRQQGEKG